MRRRDARRDQRRLAGAGERHPARHGRDEHAGVDDLRAPVVRVQDDQHDQGQQPQSQGAHPIMVTSAARAAEVGGSELRGALGQLTSRSAPVWTS